MGTCYACFKTVGIKLFDKVKGKHQKATKINEKPNINNENEREVHFEKAKQHQAKEKYKKPKDKLKEASIEKGDFSQYIEDPKNFLKFSKIDFDFLTKQTNLSVEEIQTLFTKFMENNKDGHLNKEQFVTLYSSLREEDTEKLNEISEFVFNAFDRDADGSITFNEFLVSYALTTKGDMRTKLNYCFDIYDSDGNGYLDVVELASVLYSMLDLFGQYKSTTIAKDLAKQCMEKLDVNNDGKVSKEEFVNGLLKNYNLRCQMSPFN